MVSLYIERERERETEPIPGGGAQLLGGSAAHGGAELVFPQVCGGTSGSRWQRRRAVGPQVHGGPQARGRAAGTWRGHQLSIIYE